MIAVGRLSTHRGERRSDFGGGHSYRLGQPGDPLEREAERSADAVLRMPGPAPGDRAVSDLPAQGRHSCAACQAGGQPCPACALSTGSSSTSTPAPGPRIGLAGRSGGTSSVAATAPRSRAVEAALAATAAGGSALPAATRAYFEPRFGADLGAVRVHTGAEAARATDVLQARAFTLGKDIAFAAGQFDPAGGAGRRLLAHELAHVVQQQRGAAAGSIARQPRAGAPHQLALDAEPCQGRTDITERFRDFAADLPGLIGAAPGLGGAVRDRLLRMVGFVFGTEGAADLLRFAVVCCRRIESSLALGRETAEAYVSEADREMGMTHRVAGLMDAYRADPGRVETLIEFLQVVAHEKRHVTLGSVAAVDPADLRPGVSTSAADHASYRIEEILSVAEEIAVAAQVLREGYEVPRAEQERLYRSRNALRHWVRPEEFERIRNLIIDQLRERYGFRAGCDNSVVAGIVHAMDTGSWFSCDRTRGEIIGGARPGLNVCSTGPDAFCRRER